MEWMWLLSTALVILAVVVLAIRGIERSEEEYARDPAAYEEKFPETREFF